MTRDTKITMIMLLSLLAFAVAYVPWAMNAVDQKVYEANQ